MNRPLCDLLVSTELECPVISLADARPAPPDLFGSVWRTLAGGGAWQPGDFGVWRERRETPRMLCINSAQAMSTDTGPCLELVTSPARTVAGVARQLTALEAEAGAVLAPHGYSIIGSGVHPTLRGVAEDYYRYRTPRPSYDYVIRERGWHHWSILNVCSVQEIVDVSFDDAPRALGVLHRLSGLMNFLLRNDPDLTGDYGNRLSVRSLAWRRHVPSPPRFGGDAGKFVLPEREVMNWREYLSLLWETSPMFPVGTKSQEAAFLPQHPTFIQFVLDAPREGWPARTLAGQETRVTPERLHLEKTDWTYMGFARIRWKWREGGGELGAFAEAWRTGAVEGFLRNNLEKVVIENRCNSAQPPGEELVSLYLVAGLLANLREAHELALCEPYAFWLRVLDASTTEPIGALVDGRSIVEYAHWMLDAARRGLSLRGEEGGDDGLCPLYRRLDERRSPAERMLEEFRSGGSQALLNAARL